MAGMGKMPNSAAFQPNPNVVVFLFWTKVGLGSKIQMQCGLDKPYQLPSQQMAIFPYNILLVSGTMFELDPYLIPLVAPSFPLDLPLTI